MPKFMILYNANVNSTERMANATPEEMKASMGEWMAWREVATKAAKVEFGLPLQIVGRVTPEGVSDSVSKVSGYSIIEADSKDAVTDLLESHPQLKMPGSTIDVFEMLAMPGL